MLSSKKENLLSQNPVKLKKNALTVLEKRYLKRNLNGKTVENAEELFFRVAQNIAQADKNYDKNADIDAVTEEFYLVLSSLEFLPNSPTLMNAGRHLQQLSACFVLPIEDSMDSIFETLKNTALIHKSGGGTGFSFSNLRPKQDIVKTTSGVSSGPVSFMQVFNSATEAIKQGGTRRGANMGILRVDHPDILDFITCKDKNDSMNNFNISVAITDKFMEALKNESEYNIYNPRTGKSEKTLNANEIFEKIVEQAWKNGEPGIIFIDKMNEKNPTPDIAQIESTNPCGEQPLLSYESCNLGSINLNCFIENKDVNWVKLDKVIKTAVHFLDNVIDMNNYPISKIAEITRSNRKIGLGIMGWSDMLLSLEIAYGSDKSLDLAEKIASFIQSKSHEYSCELAAKRGAFPNFDKSIYAKGQPIRNATTTTIAPTGTIGIIASASGGIEPIFALVYKRSNCLDNEEMYEINPIFEKIAKEQGFYSTDIMEEVAASGSIANIKKIPEKIREIFVTSHDISAQKHIKMQAAFQKFTDNAVSKTINFPHSATKEDVKNAYLFAYANGCKGITVYRDGSRDMQVLNIAGSSKKISIDQSNQTQTAKKPRIRPKITKGFTFLMRTGCGKMYVTINEDDKGTCEIFTQLGKSGGCASSQAEATARLISIALRSGIEQKDVVTQLKGIRCPSPIIAKEGAILSCADAVAKAMEAYEKEKQNCNSSAVAKKVLTTFKKEHSLVSSQDNNQYYYENSYHNGNGACPQCPECGEMLVFSESCVTCRGCGYSKCF
ncbi:MAG: vitamin B12-dependent ribonucleotide reductase [Elusimicrobiota bacterium]|jgi:ribonucleoside-diphosphate reductase alpha chain|nr:vitamin B12-dependent ribonucleotide reductase [Elusimicrobiota bacterium]